MSLEPIILEDEFVRLEPLAEKHRAPLAEAGDDRDLWRFASVNLYGTDFDQWMEDRLSAPAREGDLTFAVYDQLRLKYVGSSSFLKVELPSKRLEIGWTWYAKSAWSTHVNPACKRLMLRYGFETLGLNRIEFKLDATNKRSWKAVERLGAIYEGVRRAHMVKNDGRVRDSAYFSVLKNEWPDVNEKLEARLVPARDRYVG